MLTRRRLLRSGAAAGLAWSWPARASSPLAPFPVHFRKSNPYESLRPLVEPGHAEFKNLGRETVFQAPTGDAGIDEDIHLLGPGKAIGLFGQEAVELEIRMEL